MLIRGLIVVSAAAVALAQGPPAGSEPPKLHGETLEGKAIVLPDAGAGKVTMIVVGASRKGGDRTGPWKDHFAADFGSNAHADYYVAALLQRVPGMVRGMIRSGMRGGTPPAARSHVLTCASDEDAWKKYLAMSDDSLPSVLLLDASGRVRWSFNGVFDDGRYQGLKSAVTAALENRSSN
jgi:hypothetical protein